MAGNPTKHLSDEEEELGSKDDQREAAGWHYKAWKWSTEKDRRIKDRTEQGWVGCVRLVKEDLKKGKLKKKKKKGFVTLISR